MNVFTQPLKYLWLRNEKGYPIAFRNIIPVIMICAALSAPFYFNSDLYFADKGFLDRFSSLSAVLTGFYIAALVGIASFAATLGDLDRTLTIGKVYFVDNKSSDERIYLTRRQYVCAMFGYLAFLSMSIFLISILSMVLFNGLCIFRDWRFNFPATIFLNLCISHMIVTTFHGLYYLIERLYDKESKMLDKNGEPVED